MARTVQMVGTEELRDWARETDWRDEKGREVSERGRVSTKLINDYNKANKRHFKQYQPISRNPQNYAPQPAVSEPEPETRQSSRASTPAPSRRTEAPAASSASTVENSNGVNSLSEVIRMLQAAQKKGNGTPAVVTIQTLVNV
jgi:hypothetical protein